MRIGDDGYATLELEPRARCPGCPGLCTWRVIGRERLLVPMDGLDVAPGAAVELRVPASSILAGAFFLYGLPLLGLLAGAALGGAVVGSDFAVLVGAMAGLALVFGVTPTVRARMERRLLGELAVKRVP